MRRTSDRLRADADGARLGGRADRRGGEPMLPRRGARAQVCQLERRLVDITCGQRFVVSSTRECAPADVRAEDARRERDEGDGRTERENQWSDSPSPSRWVRRVHYKRCGVDILEKQRLLVALTGSHRSRVAGCAVCTTRVGL